jgi:hypothetical protein
MNFCSCWRSICRSVSAKIKGNIKINRENVSGLFHTTANKPIGSLWFRQSEQCFNTLTSVRTSQET